MIKSISNVVLFGMICAAVACHTSENVQKCASTCKNFCSESRSPEKCFSYCTALMCGPNTKAVGVSSGSSASSSYPTGHDTTGSSSGFASQAEPFWAWGGVNGRDKVYFRTYEEMQNYLYRNSGNCGGE